LNRQNEIVYLLISLDTNYFPRYCVKTLVGSIVGYRAIFRLVYLSSKSNRIENLIPQNLYCITNFYKNFFFYGYFSALDNIREGIGYQIVDFIALVARVIGCLVYSLSVGWKLSLVFLSVSPLIIITFNATVAVSKAFAKEFYVVLQKIRIFCR
jgi:hypothetical protein